MLSHLNSIESIKDEGHDVFYDVLLTSEMLRYYCIFPKLTEQNFAIFFSTPELALEIKLELEMILGIKLDFENLAENKIIDLIANSEVKENLLRRLAV